MGQALALPIGAAALLALITANASALDGLKLELNVGQLNGTMGEHVLNPTTGYGNGRRVSQLDWDLSEVVMVGLGAQFDLNSKVSVRGEFWKNAGDANGMLTDRDWLAPFAATPPGGLAPYSDEAWTDRSIHTDAPVKDVTQLELSLEVRPFQTVNYGGAAIEPRLVAGVRRDSYQMTSFGGTGTLSVGTFRDTPVALGPNTEYVDYKQEFTAPFVGAGADIDLGRIGLSIEGAIGQYEAEMTDNHYLTNLRYYDSIEEGQMYMLEAQASTDLGRFLPSLGGFHLTAGVDYVHYQYEEGDGVIAAGPTFATVATAPGGIGAEMEATTFSIGISNKF